MLVDFWEFSEGTWPEDYEKIDERFSNTWFFDENNKLAWQCRVSELRKDADNFISEGNVDVDISKVFWKYYDLYRRKIITLEEYAKKTHLSREVLMYYLAIIRDLPGESIS